MPLKAEYVERRAVELGEWILRHGIAGYDPYDALSSPLAAAVDRRHPFLGRVAIHALKSLPVNVRPAMGIRRELDAKALGLLGRGFLRLGARLSREDFREQGLACARRLVDLVTPGYAGACWGHPFPYRSSRAWLPRDFPTVVSTVYAAQLLLDVHEMTGDADWRRLGRSACEFVLRDLDRIGTAERFCFGYYPGRRVQVHNASLLGAQLLARVAKRAGEPELARVARGAVRFALGQQRDDGAWFYDAGDPATVSHSFVDGYHTGFVLESLFDIARDAEWPEIDEPLRRGLSFYARHLFRSDGRPVSRLGRRSAVDLRDCAQGLIVFGRMRAMLPAEHRGLPGRLAEWTVREMRARAGFYRAAQAPRFVPAVPYVRFQGWMLWAWAVALEGAAEP
jgi:hypothetical protein